MSESRPARRRRPRRRLRRAPLSSQGSTAVSSVRDSRQRAAARAKLEREMADRREAAQHKRRMQARIGAGAAGVVVLAAVVWIIVAASSGSSKPTATSGPTACAWNDQFANTSPSPLPSGIKDVGLPPTDVPRTGFQVVTFDTNQGT